MHCKQVLHYIFSLYYFLLYCILDFQLVECMGVEPVDRKDQLYHKLCGITNINLLLYSSGGSKSENQYVGRVMFSPKAQRKHHSLLLLVSDGCQQPLASFESTSASLQSCLHHHMAIFPLFVCFQISFSFEEYKLLVLVP